MSQALNVQYELTQMHNTLIAQKDNCDNENFCSSQLKIGTAVTTYLVIYI